MKVLFVGIDLPLFYPICIYFCIFFLHTFITTLALIVILKLTFQICFSFLRTEVDTLLHFSLFYILELKNPGPFAWYLCWIEDG